jgi:predicted AAA+ superfamily ATPase
MKEIVIEQNKHWDNQKYSSAKRDVLDKLISYLPLKQIITITGIRRCGKSTLAKQAINHLLDSGVAKENIFFINLENPYFLEYKHDAKFLNTIFEEYLKLMNPKGRIYCIFDEIQYFDNWQVYIKSKYESSDIKYIITGSNSSMLSHELATLLSGRSLNIHLYTFSFTEFLDFKGIDYKSEFAQIKNRIDIARAKDEYLKWGGFYEVFEISDEMAKKDILISYAKNIIYQDIIPRYGIRNSEIVERLFYYLLTTATRILNYTTLSKTFEISDKTIKEYINYFEDVFIFKRIDRFHNKPKEKVKSTKKIYALDNGFLQIAPTNSKNLGTSLENEVFIELNKTCEEVTYIKENYEIDFRCADTLYQVTYEMEDEKTRQRELRVFKNFDKDDRYKHKVLTYDETSSLDEIEILKYEDFVFGLDNTLEIICRL